MAVILQFKLLDYSSVVDTIETMVSSVGLNGPSNLTDSALSLWAIMMEFRTKANPNLGQDTSKQICGWLKNAWTLGKISPIDPV
jgi:ataxia telangiectasia mutated family protein